jgi:N-acetylneuraminic acid mutarotase
MILRVQLKRPACLNRQAVTSCIPMKTHLEKEIALLPDRPGLILEGRDGAIYVAVFDAADGIIVRHDGDSWQPWHQGPVYGFQIAPDGDIWVAGSEILHYQAATAAVERTSSFSPRDTTGPLLITRAGDVWCSGCENVRRGDAHFSTTPTEPPGWSITACCDDPFGNLWAIATNGKRRDLAILNPQQPHAWRRIELPDKYGARPWTDPIVDDSGFIWVGLERSVLRVDPRSQTGHCAISCPGESTVTALTRLANRQIAVGFSDGSIRELMLTTGEEPVWTDIKDSGSGAVQALLHDRKGDLWILSNGQVQRIDALHASWQAHWDEQPRMPAGNHDHIFARIDDRLYAAGGKTYFGWPADEWVNLDHIWSYSISAGTWRVEPPMLEPGKAYSGIASLAGELWLLGGLFRDEEAGNGTRPTDTVEIYDPKSRHSRFGPSLPRAAGQIVAVTVDARLYAIGGETEDGLIPEVYSISPDETEWSPRASAPGPVFQASGCVLDGKIYVAAGPSSGCPGLFVYNPASDSWSQVERPVKPVPGAPLCTAFDGRVWVLGGRGKGGGQTATCIYTPESNQWQVGPDIPLPSSWAAAADADGRLLIAGGAYEDDLVGGYFNTDRVFFLRQEHC